MAPPFRHIIDISRQLRRRLIVFGPKDGHADCLDAEGRGDLISCLDDPFARQASAFGPGEDSAAPARQAFGLASWQEGVLAEAGVVCCSVYWRTTEKGAPPQDAAM